MGAIEQSVTRRIGNYNECRLTMTRRANDVIELKVETRSPYGDEWGGNHLDPGVFPIIAPAVKSMLRELGVDVDTPPDAV